MTLKGKELMVGRRSLSATFHSSWESCSKVLTKIFMIGFVIHGPYTDGAYAYSILTPGTFRHSYYMTMVIWSLSILTMNNEGQGVLLQRVGLELLGGCKNSCLLQHEQSGISFDEIFRRGNLLVHCNILVNHFPTGIKTFLISVFVDRR
jgi:hypothetical protein